MKQLSRIILAAVFSCGLLYSCGDGGTDPTCGSYNGKTLYKGPNGGCYYMNSNGNKSYVDRTNCKC